MIGSDKYNVHICDDGYLCVIYSCPGSVLVMHMIELHYAKCMYAIHMFVTYVYVICVPVHVYNIYTYVIYGTYMS